MRVVMPKSARFQCPACGTPVTVTELRYVRPGSAFALLLEDCGHVVSLELIRDAWGIDIPEPSPPASYDT